MKRYEPRAPALIAESMRALCPHIRLCIQSANDEEAQETARRTRSPRRGTGWSSFSSAEPADFPDSIRIEYGDDVTGMGRYYSNAHNVARALGRELRLHGIVVSSAASGADDLAPEDVRIVVGAKRLGP